MITVATEAHRSQIYRLRHSVYASELAQHPQNAAGVLSDELDSRNVYLAALNGGEVVGFISITPPGELYSIDKYLARDQLPFACDHGLHEIRLLTVLPGRRGQNLAALLMYAALRWVEAHGGTHVVALGREEILSLYLQVGLRPVGHTLRAGAVVYHLLHAPTDAVRTVVAQRRRLVARLEREMEWHLPIPFEEEPGCYHGGAFFQAVGDEFGTLERSADVINADVLDAWFPPSPHVLAELRDHLAWLVRTSPPTDCGGMVRTIARARDVDPACILPGGGSSDLIFLALTRWLSRDSRVLILDPMYGEYSHVLERVVRCRVDRLRLRRADGYVLDPARLLERVQRVRYDLVILVNPNSPTGRHVPRAALEAVLTAIRRTTLVWIDETYIDYTGDGESLERFAAQQEGVVVCKSMSKAYALSGMRVAYLCAAPILIRQLRAFNPPWAVGLPAQVAAVRALEDREYYSQRWRETHQLRDDLGQALLRRLGFEVVPGVANFLLCHLPESGPTDAATLVARARQHQLYLRDAGTMGTALGARAVRIAVKDAATNRKMLHILSQVMDR